MKAYGQSRNESAFRGHRHHFCPCCVLKGIYLNHAKRARQQGRRWTID